MAEITRPNILFISAEQQRGDALHCAATADGGSADWMITPNLDSLAEQGVLFRQNFCAGPTCSSTSRRSWPTRTGGSGTPPQRRSRSMRLRRRPEGRAPLTWPPTARG